MKTIYSVIMLLVFVITSNAQVLNGNFEEWSSGEPLYWISNNLPPQWAPITQTTDAHSGNFALKGEALATGIPNFTYTPFIQALFPFTGRPERVTGYFKLVSSAGDGFGVTVALMKNGQPVGSGGFGTTNVDTAYQQFVAPMFYQDSTTTPDTMLFIISMFSPDPNIPIAAGSAYYLDDISTLTITKPKTNELFVAGEKDTIKWYDEAIENVNLYYSLDEGASFSPIIMNHPMDSLKYVWDVPSDLLSRKALIKIEESENTVNNSLSPVFRIKPWQLSRVNGNGDYLTPLFQPNKDGWSFNNSGGNIWPQSWWQQFDYFAGIDPNTNQVYPLLFQFRFAKSSDFIDWPLFVEIFGIPQCYFTGLNYKTRALNYWQVNRENWGGSCYGFAVTSLLAYYNKSGLLNRFPGIGSFADLINAPLNDESRKAINYYFAYQFGDPFASYATQRWNSVTARETLAELKEMFERDNGDGKTLAFYSNDPSNPGGHAVTPYKLERIGDTPAFNLRVYDSNLPGSSNQIIKIDSAANTWTDQTGLGWGTGTTGSFLNLENAVHLSTPILPKNNSNAKGQNEFLTFSSGGLQLFNNSRNGILITNESGESIGFSDSLLIQNIIDAVPIIPKTGSVHPPIGYSIPPGDYYVELTNLVDSMAYVIFIEDSIIYNYFRNDAEVGQLDQVYFNEGIALKNSDQVTKNIMLQTVLDDENSEKVFLIDNMNLSLNDSVFASESDRNKLIIKNYGQNKNYDLSLRLASDNGQSIFTHNTIPQNFNSTHTIIPEWNNLQNQPVKILIDLGNDGSIDDSIFVQNQATSIDDQGILLSPNSYNLAQNYPNPFNPTTTIKYSIPESGNVSLKVFDILGNEVASLVNEEKTPGVYSVTFDASQLSSGVYFYKIQAGSYVETKKMLLLK